MYTYLISIFLKRQAAHAADAINPRTRADEPGEGDVYERAFHQPLSFRDASDAGILREVYGLFHGEGSEHPASAVRLPRPLDVGDIIVGLETVAFVITAKGFRALPFSPRGESFEVTAEHAARTLSSMRKPFQPLHADAEIEAARHVVL